MPQMDKGGTPITRYRDGMSKYPEAIGMLIEGDSWFAFPMWLRTNIVAELKKIFGNAIVQLDLSKSGDEVREMLCGAQFAKLYDIMAKRRLTFDCILFSGGGNDIVADNLPVLLRQYESGMAWQDCLNETRFKRRLQEIENAYRDLSDLRDDYQPEAWIFTHGYDHALPSGKGVHILGLRVAGGWLQRVMNEFQIPEEFQSKIVRYMLTSFDKTLTSLSQTHENWVHVPTQKTLSDSDWSDELHPNEDGFKNIAKKFKKALIQTFPQLEGALEG